MLLNLELDTKKQEVATLSQYCQNLTEKMIISKEKFENSQQKLNEVYLQLEAVGNTSSYTFLEKHIVTVATYKYGI